jgi:heterodisulfide reductase subunit B
MKTDTEYTIRNAVGSGAECLVTARAMRHLNLDIRCSLKKKIPILIFLKFFPLLFKSN